MSYADRWTDEQLADLEERISRVYSDAQKDFEKQSREYFGAFAKKDEEKRKKVESGELSKDEYKQWRLTQMGRGERLNHMARQMSERATKANEVAVAYVNDTTPGIYSLNRNHEAYVIEGLGHEMVGADFSLYNEQAVRRLVVENPDIMPYYPEKRAVARGIDLDYGQKYIKRHVLGGIIQGKSVYKIADDLQRDVADMNRASAIRTARTAITAAQNGGRQATMDSARAMGIKLRKRWVAAKDGRTRDVHGVADGQTVPTDEPFIVGGEKMMFPGDRTSASGWNLYNCRCGMRTVEKEGIEAEPRQVRIQNPAWTDAYEAEEKAKAKYERALEKEKAETDPEKKKALRKQRLEKQHEYEALQKKRREIPKNKVVGDMTYTEWAKLRGLSSEKSLTSSKGRGKINLKNSSKKPYTKIKVDDIPPMDEKRFKKMSSGLEKNGVAVIQDEEGDRYLTAMVAEAMTLSDGSAVIFQSGRTPSASAVFEEVIHTTQIRKRGTIDSYGDDESKAEQLYREIEAGEKMLKHQNAYGLTKEDVESIKENLDFYYNQREM